ncbi:hypothetical protein GHT06_020129 [Daphnia sinensis]|uniref:DUF7587 domain-containing protein n=1 Tax=Daphnia sinensis TaxID=1820382 RepID=A0AAD5PQ02_9CRUS|nr:hypothetical protein GHT06_020129 [Daphnia sinensis]
MKVAVLLAFASLALCPYFSDAGWPIAENGKVCRSQCLKNFKLDYYTCATNLLQPWNKIEKCNPAKVLGNGKSVLTKTQLEFCTSECSTQGYSYTWCWTPTSWDYCEPSSTRVRQHITRWGEYCTGPCTKDGTDYYWCRRGSVYDSLDTWDYCSPEVGLTRYAFKCKPEHPCAKHGGKDYYWCNIESNHFKWDWDYCSPPYDLYEYKDDYTLNFVGNFNVPDDQDLQQSCQVRSKRASGDWTSYPFVYRILAGGRILPQERDIDEGTGFDGIVSRMLRDGRERPTINQRIQIPRHVAENPDDTPWISTSANFELQDCTIRSNVERRFRYTSTNAHYLYLVTIDVRYLIAGTNQATVVNLNDDRVRNALLSFNRKAYNYARTWKEVLIYWEIPPHAIVNTRRYYINRYTFKVEFVDIQNPYYCGEACKGQRPKDEDFFDEDRSYGGGYPNYL